MTLTATPRKPVPAKLSPTALNRYSSCPQQFAYQHLRDDIHKEREASPNLAMGNAVHAALDAFFGLDLELRSVEILHQCLRSRWGKLKEDGEMEGAFVDREDEIAWGTQALEMLTTFSQTFDMDAVPVARETWASARLPGSAGMVFGRLDRADLNDDGSLTVTDYKTGRRPLDEEDLPTDSGALVYAVASARMWRRHVSRVRFIYLPLGIEVRWDLEEEDLEAAEQRLTRQIDRIRSDHDFAATPGDACRFCSFALVCPDKGRVYLDDLVLTTEVGF